MIKRAATHEYEKDRWSRRLDGFVFVGLLLLTVFVLRNPDVRSAWRAGLLLLGVLSLAGWLVFRPARWKGIVPQVRRLVLAGMAFVAIVDVASLAGPTVEVAPEQFFLGFLLPVLIPWLIFRHVRDRERWDWLMAVFAVAALILVFRNLAQYVQEWLALGKLSSDVNLHRRFAVNLVFGLPFLLWIAVGSRQRWLAATGWLLAIVSLVMIVATGARGAWLGAFVVIMIYLLFLRSRRLFAASAAGLAIAVIAGLTVIPPELVVNKIQQGMDTSNRTAGTWGPAIEMIRDRPLLGYGLGDDVFHQEFNRRVVTAEHWTIRQSLGPHSFFLALGFAAGLPALLVLLLLLWLALWPMGRRVPTHLAAGGAARSFGLSGVALLAAVSGAYVVIGNVENLNWNLFGFWLGMSMVWLQLDAGSSLPDPGS
jgi:O-antigen ligase